MNEADLKAIEELLNKQAEAFSKQMDVRFDEQDKRLDSRFQEQEVQLEKRMIHIFSEGFEQVVLPHITELSSKVNSLNNKVDDLDSRTGRIERKLDAVVEYQDRQGQEIKSIKKYIHMPEGA